MPALPTSIALTSPANASTILAADVRNDNSAVQTAVNGLITALDDGVAGQVLGGAGSTVTFAYPPGYQIAYVEATSPVSVTSTVEATPTDVLSAGSVTFDGSAVWVEFFYPYFQLPAAVGGGLYLTLWNDTTQIGRLSVAEAESATVRTQPGGTFKRKITPTAAAHTIKVAGLVSSGTGIVGAGTGVTTSYEPAFIRITKA